jgi:hypothetical protein
VRNANGMPKDNCIYVIARIGVNAPHELDQLPSLRQAMAPSPVDILTNEMQRHATFPYFRYD